MQGKLELTGTPHQATETGRKRAPFLLQRGQGALRSCLISHACTQPVGGANPAPQELPLPEGNPGLRGTKKNSAKPSKMAENEGYAS